MTIASLAGEGSTLTLLGRVVALTLFYAALCWLPLRGTAAVVGRAKSRTLRRKKGRRQPQPESVETTWVIR